MIIGSSTVAPLIHFFLSIHTPSYHSFVLYLSRPMHHINWKKTSEFVSIIDQIKNGEDDIVITIARHVHLWWFHVRIIWSLSSKKNIVFITNDERAKKLLKQSGYKVFISFHDMRQVFPDGFVLMRENITTFEYVRFHISRFFSKFSVIFRGISAKPYDVFFVKQAHRTQRQKYGFEPIQLA